MLSIKVGDPKKEGTGFSAKTTYLISTTIPTHSLSTKNMVELQTFTIRRRSCEFLKAYGRWKQLNPILPPLPPKTALKRFADDTVQRRLEAFNNILKRSLLIRELRESRDFLDFLGIHHDFVVDGQENEPWYYDTSLSEGCASDQDLDRICQSYRQNKPDASDLLEGMKTLSLKYRHLAQLLKLLEDRTEEERRYLVQWAVLRLEDLHAYLEDKELLLKNVRYLSERKWVDMIMMRAIEIRRKEAEEKIKSNSTDQDEEVLDNMNANSTDENNAGQSSTTGNTAQASLRDFPTTQQVSDSISSELQNILNFNPEMEPGRSAPRRPPPSIPVVRTSELGGKSVQGNSDAISSPSRPNAPPPPLPETITSDISSLLSMLRGSYVTPSTNESSPSLSRQNSTSGLMPQAQLVNLFASLQSDDFQTKKDRIESETKSSVFKCQQVQYILGSFSTDEERKEILPILRVYDPENYMVVQGYSKEFENYAQDFIKNLGKLNS